MNKSMWNNEAVKAYESGQGVMMVKEPHPHYVPVPKHTWVGLTDEERNNIWDTIGNSDAHGDVDGWSGRDVMKAIEAKLKEKNT
jgi:hypothetical protein